MINTPEPSSTSLGTAAGIGWNLANIKSTRPVIIVILRLVICLAISVVCGYITYSNAVNTAFDTSENIFNIGILVFSTTGVLVHLMNLKKLHNWYAIYNKIWFVMELLIYIVYVLFIIVLSPVILITSPKTFLNYVLSLAAFSFYTYFGYIYYQIIKNSIRETNHAITVEPENSPDFIQQQY